MAGLAVRPKTRMRWTGSAVCLASSRIRSCRILDGVSPIPAKMASMTVRAIGGPEPSAAVWLVTSRWGLPVSGQQRCRSRSQPAMRVRESSSR